MAQPKPAQESVTVAMRILAAAEFADLSADRQTDIEATTRQLLAQYGEDWFRREHDRLRDELLFSAF